MEVVVTDLRVHAIPAMMDFVDYSADAVGMIYLSSTLPGGATVDGTQDVVPGAVPTWEAVTGAQGTFVTTNRMVTSFATPTMVSFYRDQATPPEAQCWGDSSFLGASGVNITSGIPNTDPAAPPVETLRGTRTVHFLPPVGDTVLVGQIGADLAADADEPLDVTVSPYDP
jgi:hypothetical protein